MKKVIIFSNNNFGSSLSGGDQIQTHFCQYLISLHYQTTVFGSQETQNVYSRAKTNPQSFILTDQANPSPIPNTINISLHQFRRTIYGLAALFRHRDKIKSSHIIYSASDFYPDLLPALIAKLLYPHLVWIAGYYLIAPPPFSSNSPYRLNHQFLKGLLYFLGQIPTRLLTNLFADHVFITSQPDSKHFPRPKVHVIQGGVDTVSLPITPPTKKYQAVFVGRLHPQKGSELLPQIWHRVVQKLPHAKLVIIGDGQMAPLISDQIRHLRLQKNITMLGFLSGHKRDKIFLQSSLVLHPATFDSGGMAAAEAMVYGLPAVGFNLPAFKTYYPKGMLKVPRLDLDKFASAILYLLSHPHQYSRLSQSAIQTIRRFWSWDYRFSRIWPQIDLPLPSAKS